MTQRWIATSQNCKLRLIVRARSPRPICGKLERQSSPSLPEKCERVTGAGTPGAWVCHLRTTPNQRPLPSEQMRHERDLRKMLDCFHLHVSMIQVAAVCNHAMVRHQNRIVLWNQGFQRVCELRGAWRAVLRQRN